MGKIKVTRCEIPGLCVIEPKVFYDERGYFVETYNYNDFKEEGLDMQFVQDNQSMSVKGVLRGLHYQKQYPQGKLVRCIRGKVFDVAAKEFAAAEKAGLSKILADRKAAAKGAAADEEEVKAPPAEPCTASIPGIEVMDLEDAAKVLWKAGIYAETGMGCTGPLVMMSDANHAKAVELLKAEGYIG